jgi:dTDP-4-dehydrorhamnose reductase
MRILVTGGRGQLARGILRRGPASGAEVIALGRDALDIEVAAQAGAALAAFAPDLVINAAAFTNVDRAETERGLARAVNALGAGCVAQACGDLGTPLLHVSTDYVFDGAAARPYREDDPVAPLGVYAATKAEGERRVLAAGGTVVRTSWLFGDGGPSFVHAIARRAVEAPVLRVVDDQRGNPTWVDDLADALLALAEAPPGAEILHVCGDEPVTRHAFACAIVDELRRLGPVACERIEPISTAESPAPAARPPYSVLDTTRARSRGLPIRSWRGGLRAMLAAERGGR